MTYPTMRILKGPDQRDLEQAFVARNQGAFARFRILLPDSSEMSIELKILNFKFVTCHGAVYEVAGHPRQILEDEDKKRLPPFGFIFVKYNPESKSGEMEFSNGG